MGIESDQVVYEYLSRVGDVAHQRQLPSAARMRLVSQLRDDIDRARAKAAVDSPVAVRRILDRLGTPDEVVEAAGAVPGAVRAPEPPPASVPVQREPRAGARPGAEAEAEAEAEADGQSGAETQARAPERPRGLRRVVPRPRPAARPQASAPHEEPSPPHLAAAHELGDGVEPPDWWRVESGPFGAVADDAVPGFVGGVEVPEMLRRPPKEEPAPQTPPEPDPAPAAPAPAVPPPAPLRRLFSRRAPAPAPASPAPAAPASRTARRLLPAAGWTNPLLLLAAAALVAGAVLGNWFALLLGWAVAYGSRRLTPAETKWAVLGVPGLALAAGVTWLWGRQDGRWGTPVAQGHMDDAVAGTWPWVVRGAAVASALYLVWRSQRGR
ncbi:hypothetical protein QQY24_17740 [Streptomyces sp. TG1A-8]|uniref:hypothetical protein n=1 Tax=Streptomyces sp. TG1A-8 TaxID=3051385 RepID=UPI00265BD1FB|nr:hypothetical protein [Streptomyces sp. TG1A-8]MDO0927167.1 hypothetical protein [Streptomyces sp. TG1A-8]